MKRRDVLAVLTALFISPLIAHSADSRPDASRLKGKWIPVSIEENGRVAATNRHYSAIVLGNDAFIFESKPIDYMPMVYRANPLGPLKRIDIFTKTESGKETVAWSGIYEFQNELLRLCLGRDSRPLEFKTRPNDGRILYTLKKEKESPDRSTKPLLPQAGERKSQKR